MDKQTVFTVMVTVTALIGVILWELGLQSTDSKAAAVLNAKENPRKDWSNYFEAALIVSVLIALYVRFYASHYALPKINRALSLACILLFAAVVVVLVKTAPCGTAYESYTPCFDVLTGLAFGFALLDLVVFLVWKCLFHYNHSPVHRASNAVVVKMADVEAPEEAEVEIKSDAALEKEEEAKKEAAEAAEAKKEEEAKEEVKEVEEEKKEEVEEKKEEVEEVKEEEKAEAEPEPEPEPEPSEAAPLLQEEVATEEKKDEEKQ